VGLPVGTIVLILVAILVFFGVLHRVLDRMRLSDRAALVIVLAMAAGTFLDITISRGAIPVSVNVGGALVPLVVVVWLVATADEASEKSRSIVSAVITGLVVWGLTKVMNPEEQFMLVSPMILFGIAAGVIAALSGRSRRAAFVGGVGGILISDFIHWLELAITKTPGSVSFGGAGAFDATVVAGVVSVALMELVGEAREHVVKPPKGETDSRDQKE
jgi:uncharacterized membrane protein